MTKNSIILIGGYDKSYKIFIADENFICLYPNLFQLKNIYSELLKNVRIIK